MIGQTTQLGPGVTAANGAVTVMRPVQEQDLRVFELWDRDPEIVTLMGRKFAELDIHHWYRSLASDRSCRTLAIESREGRLIGKLELAQLNWRNGSAELRICIGERDCWNKGYGTDAIRTVLRLAFVDYGLRSIYLRVFATNTRAIRVYERVGFRKEAILQPSARRADPSAVVLMNLTRERWQARQARTA